MIFVEICVGSSCHLKGSEQIVELFQKAIAEHHLENDVILSGSFCTGKCNRIGVTIQVDDAIFTGIIPEHFPEFFEQHILSRIGQEV
ncbi:MAG TPA: hypothetical protein DCO72_06095 [Ruminococcus sp.]|nr:hypothetical protein [Ruminococcus sp.]